MAGVRTEPHPFRNATRILSSVLSPLEKRTLLFLAARMPAWVNSDHLTSLGLVAMLGAGLSFWLAGTWPAAARAGGRLPGRQLVWRQPGRHAGARAQARAAALRLLRRPHRRRVRRAVPARRPGALRLHESAGRGGPAHRVPDDVRRGLSGGPHAGPVQAHVLHDGPDRTADPAVDRRALAAGPARRDRSWAGPTSCSMWVASRASPG